MSTILLIRPEGPYGRAALRNDTIMVQTSVAAIGTSNWQAEEIAEMDLGTVILEDLRLDDLSGDLRGAIMRAAAGRSCPIVTRWTTIAPDDAR